MNGTAIKLLDVITNSVATALTARLMLEHRQQDPNCKQGAGVDIVLAISTQMLAGIIDEVARYTAQGIAPLIEELHQQHDLLAELFAMIDMKEWQSHSTQEVYVRLQSYLHNRVEMVLS